MGFAAIVVGLGSMGKRRIRLLRQAYPDILIGGVDTQQSRREEVKLKFDIATYGDMDAAIAALSPQVGFVCTSPLSHKVVATTLLERKIHVFSEINLVDDGYDHLMDLAESQHCELFLSSTFLYRKDIQYIIERIKGQKVNYYVHIGQYLPDWHPWESYKDFFASNIRTNGCREIFAIDLPWMLAAFGDVESFTVLKDKASSLDIEYEDNYIVTFQHCNGSKGVMFCDLITRKGGRNLKIFSENIHLTWAGTPDSLFDYEIGTGKDQRIETYMDGIDHQSQYNSNIIENAYLEEINTFFHVIEGRQQAPYTFEKDKKTIALINKIEGRS